jgi:RNA polymerase sigma-70 factor (ECF subfamily)
LGRVAEKIYQKWASELNSKYRGPLRAYFRRRGWALADSEDLVQEVFLRLLRRSTSTETEFPAEYIFTVAANILRDRYRASGIGAVTAVEGRVYELALRAGVAFDPERLLMGKEAVGELQRALATLPERTRVILILDRIERLPRRTIAEGLGISESAVEKHLSKGLAKIGRRIRGK